MPIETNWEKKLHVFKRRLAPTAAVMLFFGFLISLPAEQFKGSDVKDPGVRGGDPGAGKPIAGLTSGELDMFNNMAKAVFAEEDKVANGLGPRFNLNSCAGCHAFPATGGSSPSMNPQAALAATIAPGNVVPDFITPDGPVREVRFINYPDGTPDGGVHSIFTISGRSDKPSNCAIPQPDYSNTSNLAFRIPTPVFGAGLIESITDSTIRQNLANESSGQNAGLGIKGHVNTNGNDGTVTRFGWKAQNKSLVIFSGEAYNVEQGVTNEVFPNERDENPDCATNGTPESNAAFNVGVTGPSDVTAFAAFMRFLAPPTPTCAGTSCSSSIQNGHALMGQIGCTACHTETLKTGASSSPALSAQPVNLFSDLAVHHMGSGLADGITQGTAGPDEFRTAPLWGLGQRIFFLHDGRTKDLVQAIYAHQSSGSEANSVINNFGHLSHSQQQDVLNFLRSL
jgi:CxxC motif-containing protein (DUF1111 family)